MKRTLVLLSLLAAACAPTVSSTPGPKSEPAPATGSAAKAPAGAIAAKVAKLKLRKIDGYLPLYWDAEDGKLFMEISRFGEEMIYQTSLPAGVGSNPIGLDRAQLGDTRIVRFDRVGAKVLMVEQNYRFRAITNDPAEQRAVADSFAQSVLAGFKVEASDDRAALVDATDFFLSDGHGVAPQLREGKQGTYSVDRNRSAIFLPRTKAFPRNTEVEATLTFATPDRPGALVRSVTPTAEAVTVREHHSFVALPDPGYKPRRIDPRVGFFGVTFADYASPFTDPLEKRWIARHRLEKKDPGAALSEPVRPIIYYVDNGAPEPIRSALSEGASWWNAAFEAAGFKNAFQVKVLPPGADPMDARYNVINWIHRSTRGWSMGEAVIDPRTGEIVKGNVLLDSLRIRQDLLIGRGLVPQHRPGDDGALSQLDTATSPSLMALARIRQLAAHEVGHTLGLDHNMAASSYGRASVMDYPAPQVKIAGGRLDFSDAYAKGIGDYDKYAIRYGYSQFAAGANEDAELDRIAHEAPVFVKDQDARPVSAAHPLGSVWDQGADPVAMLRQQIEVRRIALGEFGLRNIAAGQPLSTLEEMFLPLYLHHRYQLEAAAKSIGGLEYTYAVKEKGGVSPAPVRRIVPAARQRDAIAAVMATLDPKLLVIPQRILDVLPPRAFGYEQGTAELFEKRTEPAFDPITAATVAADIALAALLDPRRCARLVQHHAESPANPPMAELADGLIDLVMRPGKGYEAAITRATRTLLASRLADLASSTGIDPQVRAQAAESLRKLGERLAAAPRDPDEIETAHRRTTRSDIERFLARPDLKLPVAPQTPTGPPI